MTFGTPCIFVFTIQLTTADHNNRNVRDSLSQERERTSAHIRALEDKLRDMQDSLKKKISKFGISKIEAARLSFKHDWTTTVFVNRIRTHPFLIQLGVVVNPNV